uniref:Putative LAGLIDADG endonuclease n=1 Tax=Candida neerlandica TaxID=148634 RepID=B4Y549_9ASCO|nr:putative LAGLIDADG endonuclease [Candida neerlandica]ABX89440.1 putative LAGLIDADG endonuclease [Candida neerlandica]
MNTNPLDFENSYLAGLTDATGFFYANIERDQDSNNTKISLWLFICSEDRFFLNDIRKEFGGIVGRDRKNDQLYWYRSNDQSNPNLVDYFNKYSLHSRRYTQYLYWRDVHNMIMNDPFVYGSNFKSVTKLCNKLNDINIYSKWHKPK